MADFSNAARDLINDHILRTASWTMPAALWLQLHTGTPGLDGTANTHSSRVNVSSSFGTASSGGVGSNDAVVDVPIDGVDATITDVSIHSLVTGGTCYLTNGTLTTPRAVLTGDVLRFAVGEIDLTTT